MERNDLIERLRALPEKAGLAGSYKDDCLAAADFIAAQSATIASLSEALAEAEKKGDEAEVIDLPWQYATVGYPAKAKSLFGTYSIFQDDDGYTFTLDLKDISRGHASVPEAKAAAQADFATRVRSLLAPPRDLSQGGQHG